MAIVNFMYHGEVTVSEEQLSSFLQTAMILQVSGLMNTNETPSKLPSIQSNIPVRKSKPTPTNAESHAECPTKKLKVVSKTKKSDEIMEPKEMSPSQFEVVEVDKIKTEDEAAEMVLNNDIDVSENVEVIVTEKETQGSILEAALEVREKPSSILERSLTSQSGL